ncbi:hypothetical protein IWX91DRAFT_118162 [Phyllosticta citricarpa]
MGDPSGTPAQPAAAKITSGPLFLIQRDLPVLFPLGSAVPRPCGCHLFYPLAGGVVTAVWVCFLLCRMGCLHTAWEPSCAQPSIQTLGFRISPQVIQDRRSPIMQQMSSGAHRGYPRRGRGLFAAERLAKRDGPRFRRHLSRTPADSLLAVAA